MEKVTLESVLGGTKQVGIGDTIHSEMHGHNVRILNIEESFGATFFDVCRTDSPKRLPDQCNATLCKAF